MAFRSNCLITVIACLLVSSFADDSESTISLSTIIDWKKGKNEFEVLGCKTVVDVGDCVTSIKTIDDTSCEDGIPLTGLLSLVLPSLDLAEKSKSFLAPDKFRLNSLSLDKCTKTLSVNASSVEGLDLVYKNINVQNAVLIVSLHYVSDQFSWQKMEVDLKGQIEIGATSADIKLIKAKDKTEFEADLKIDKLKPSSFISMFSKDDIGNSGANIDKFTQMELKNIVLSGFFSIEGEFELTIEGHSADGSDLAYIVVQRNSEAELGLAFVTRLKEVSPAEIIGKLLGGRDLSDLPLIGKIKLDINVDIATRDFMTLRSESLTKVLEPFVGEAKLICQGLKLYVNLPLKDIVPSNERRNEVPKSIFMKISVHKGQVKFGFPEKWKSDLVSILAAFVPSAAKTLLPKGLFSDGPPKFNFKTFKFDVEKLGFDIHLQTLGPIRLSRIFSIPKLDFHVKKADKNSPVEFKINAIKKFEDGSEMVLEVKKTGESGYELLVKIPLLTLHQLVNLTGSQFVDQSVLDRISILDTGLKDLAIRGVINDKTQFRITATPILFNWDKTALECIIDLSTPVPRLALGLVIDDIDVGEVTAKLLKKEFNKLSWLTKLKISLSMSTFDQPDGKSAFESKALAQQPLKKGVEFNAITKLPDDCRGDKMCEQAKEVFKKDPSFTLQGKLTSSGLELRVNYEGSVALTKNADMKKIALVAKVGSGGGLYFEIELVIKDPELRLEGKLGIGSTGSLLIEAKMAGVWNNPFNLKNVAFANLLARIEVYPGTPVPSLNFQGELHLGRIGNGKEIVSKAGMGIDPLDVTENYFFGKIEKLTIQSIIEAFEFNCTVPEAIKETGFPNGVQASFTLSPKGKSLSGLQEKIESGFHLAGTMNLFGWKLEARIKLNLPKEFSVYASMSPLSFANGLIALRKSKEDCANGPLFYISVTPKGIEVEIRGFLSVIGIESETVVKINPSGYQFSVAGSLFNVVRANLSFEGSSGSIETADFSFSGCLSVEFSKISDAFRGDLEETSQQANEIAKATKDELKSMTAKDEKSTGWLDKLTGKINKIQDKLRDKIDEMKSTKNEKKLKCMAECKEETVPAVGLVNKTQTMMGEEYIVQVPATIPSKFKVPDLKCIAKCKGKKLINRIKSAVKKAGIKVLLKLLDKVNKIIGFVNKIQDKASKVLDVVKSTVSEIEGIVSVGLEIGKSIASAIAKGISSLLEIHHICVDASLKDAAENACLGLKINATAFKSKHINIDVSACMDVSFMKTIAQAIAKTLYPAIGAFKNGVSKAKALVTNMVSSRKGMESDMESNVKAIDNAEEAEDHGNDDDDDDDDDDEDEERKRNFIRSPLELEALSLVNERLPSFTLKDHDTMRAFGSGSYWQLVANNPPVTAEWDSVENHKPTMDIKEYFDDKGGHCHLLKRSIDEYKMVASALRSQVEAYTEAKSNLHQHVKEKKLGLESVGAELRSECEQYNCTSRDLDDVLFYLKKSEKGLEKWQKTVLERLDHQDRENFIGFRRHLRSILVKKFNIGYPAYLERISGMAKNAAKRSTLQHQGDSKVEKDERADLLVHSITKQFHKLFISHEITRLTAANKPIERITNELQKLERAAINCR